MNDIIINLIKHYGLVTGGSVGLTFLIFSDLSKTLTTKAIDKFKIIFKFKKSVPVIDESNIINHDIFNYIDFWMYSKVPTMNYKTDYRTQVFRKYLTIYLKSYNVELKKIVVSGSYKDMDDSELWKYIMNTINQIVYQYERECLLVGIPNIVISKVKERNNDTIQLTIDLIESIATSHFYTSDKNLLKMYSILNTLLSILESTVISSETICSGINGQLKGLKYIDDNGIKHIEP